MRIKRFERLYHSFRLLLIRRAKKRAEYLKKHNVLGAIGENCIWGPWLVPLYPKLIKLHDNVCVHKTAKIITHDLVNAFLMRAQPDVDFGARERLGCVELMDNVYVSMNCVVMPDVRINKNCIISAGSVVSSDIPENSIASGNPAKPVGRFDVYMAFRRLSKSQSVKFRNQNLSDALALEQWEKFGKKRENKG